MVDRHVCVRRQRWGRHSFGTMLPWLLVIAAFLSTLAYVNRDRYLSPSPLTVTSTFSVCSSGARIDCIVDGDTLWIGGVRIRVADIDTPEIHPSRCAEEQRLGTAAQLRLQSLVNAGPFSLQTVDRDVDKYGRKLRTLVRNGKSLGETLVSEGLARRWIGHRDPWC